MLEALAPDASSGLLQVWQVRDSDLIVDLPVLFGHALSESYKPNLKNTWRKQASS